MKFLKDHAKNGCKFGQQDSSGTFFRCECPWNKKEVCDGCEKPITTKLWKLDEFGEEEFCSAQCAGMDDTYDGSFSLFSEDIR